MDRVFGGHHRHAVFNDEDEFDFEEYREVISGNLVALTKLILKLSFKNVIEKMLRNNFIL